MFSMTLYDFLEKVWTHIYSLWLGPGHRPKFVCKSQVTLWWFYHWKICLNMVMTDRTSVLRIPVQVAGSLASEGISFFPVNVHCVHRLREGCRKSCNFLNLKSVVSSLSLEVSSTSRVLWVSLQEGVLWFEGNRCTTSPPFLLLLYSSSILKISWSLEGGGAEV